MKKPVNTLSIGFTRISTPHLWIEIPMGATGIGLGFILNNMNVFGQEIAGA